MPDELKSAITAAVLLAMISLAGLAWVLWRMRQSQIAPPATAPELQLMRCPRCASDMESGYTLATRGITFRKQRDQVGWLDNAVWTALPNTMAMGFRLPMNPCLHCSACRLLMIDYSRQVFARKPGPA